MLIRSKQYKLITCFHLKNLMTLEMNRYYIVFEMTIRHTTKYYIILAIIIALNAKSQYNITSGAKIFYFHNL